MVREPTPPKGGWVFERERSKTQDREIDRSEQSDLYVSLVSGLDDLSGSRCSAVGAAGPSSPVVAGLFTVFPAFESRLCDGSYRFAQRRAAGPITAEVDRTPQGGHDRPRHALRASGGPYRTADLHRPAERVGWDGGRESTGANHPNHGAEWDPQS